MQAWWWVGIIVGAVGSLVALALARRSRSPLFKSRWKGVLSCAGLVTVFSLVDVVQGDPVRALDIVFLVYGVALSLVALFILRPRAV